MFRNPIAKSFANDLRRLRFALIMIPENDRTSSRIRIRQIKP
jgi:hypothetical protein